MHNNLNFESLWVFNPCHMKFSNMLFWLGVKGGELGRVSVKEKHLNNVIRPKGYT